MIEMVREVWRYRYLVAVQAWASLKSGNANTRLGVLWWFLEPLSMMLVYYFVVEQLMGRGGPNYHVFILSALVVWKWFTQSVSQGTGAFVRNRGLILQVRFPLLSLILAPLLTNLFHMLLGLLIVLLFVWRVPGPELLYLLPLIVVQGMLTLGLATGLAIINIYLRDLEQGLGAALRAWWFLSPVLYDVSLVMEAPHVPDFAKTLFLLNPFATLLPAYRAVLLHGTAPDLTALGLWGLASLGLMLAALAALRVHQRTLPKMI